MIYKYKMNNYNIVLDVNSGSVHAVDEVTYDVLDLYRKKGEEEIILDLNDKFRREDIVESISEIKILEKEGTLFSEDCFQEAANNLSKRNPVVKALCLHIAHDCNLKCKYCFAEEGEYGGKRSLMSSEVGKMAIDFLIKNSGNRKNLEIDFFGGEPLMNFDVVKEIVEYGREQEKFYNKNFRFTITTNGILLKNEIIDYINEHMHNVVLSIDGRKKVNDKMRVKAGGQGSYTDILPKYKKLAESRNQNNYYVRGTFTKENLDFSNDVIHLAEEGFKQISIEPVVTDETESYALKEEDLNAICKEYENLAVKMIDLRKEGKDFNFFHFMLDLTGGPCVTKRLVGCGAGTEYLAVTPEGDLFPCHQFVGKDDFKMGDIKNGVTNFKKWEQFDNCNVYSKEECKQCFAKFYCSGGCASNSYNSNGDINKPFSLSCELQKKRIECAIMMKVSEVF